MSKVAKKKPSSPKLEEFPPELLGEISRQLTPETMKSLASTSKTIYGKSEYVKAESRRQVALQRKWRQLSTTRFGESTWKGIDQALYNGDSEVIEWRFKQPFTYDQIIELIEYVKGEMYGKNENLTKGAQYVNNFDNPLGRKTLTLINKKIIEFFNR
jgi:hypothetical protein